MSVFGRFGDEVRRWRAARGVQVWHSPRYRLPIASVEASGIDARRAERVAEYLLERRLLAPRCVRVPSRIGYDALSRVHSAALLERLQEPEALAELFNVDPSEVVPTEVWSTLRLACGGTLAAAQRALQVHTAALNLLGGFHHAGPDQAGGFCPVNDVAVAVAALRERGFGGSVGILDLDAHPPDGLAACFRGDASVWIGSISGVDWGTLVGVDETVLPAGTGNEAYLSALRRLLSRRPPAALTFVIAGGDLLAGDRCGGFALDLAGVWRRDREVWEVLRGTPSVWLSGGGYGRDAWRALAGTASVLLGSEDPVPSDYDALERRYRSIARGLDHNRLAGGEEELGSLMADLGRADLAVPRFLDYYTTEGIEYAFERYGLFAHLRHLGYGGFRLVVDREPHGHRLRVFGAAGSAEHLLLDTVLERASHDGEEWLYIHWLTMRHPRARFSERRPQLPGQDAPGLGLAREAGELLTRAAERLGLTGLRFRPAWYHLALQARQMGMRFEDPEREGRFEAMVRDLGHLPLRSLSLALDHGRVRMNGVLYRWEATPMVGELRPRARLEARIATERARVGFELG